MKYINEQNKLNSYTNMASTSGLVAMTSASHAEGRQFNPGEVYTQCS